MNRKVGGEDAGNQSRKFKADNSEVLLRNLLGSWQTTAHITDSTVLMR